MSFRTQKEVLLAICRLPRNDSCAIKEDFKGFSGGKLCGDT